MPAWRGRRVWPHEVWSFLVRDRRITDGPTVKNFWGAPQDAEEEASRAGVPERASTLA